MSTILIPIDEDLGRQSVPNSSFGSSPFYLLVDTDNPDKDVVIRNSSAKFGGDLPPIKFILGLCPSAVFTTHACQNALNHMAQAGVTPYLVEKLPVAQLLDLYFNQRIAVMTTPSH